MAPLVLLIKWWHPLNLFKNWWHLLICLGADGAPGHVCPPMYSTTQSFQSYAVIIFFYDTNFTFYTFIFGHINIFIMIADTYLYICVSIFLHLSICHTHKLSYIYLPIISINNLTLFVYPYPYLCIFQSISPVSRDLCLTREQEINTFSSLPHFFKAEEGRDRWKDRKIEIYIDI